MALYMFKIKRLELCIVKFQLCLSMNGKIIGPSFVFISSFHFFLLQIYILILCDKETIKLNSIN